MTKTATARRSHRATFPTPGFYLFSFFLNALAVTLSALLIAGDLSRGLVTISMALLALFGLVISIYASVLKPKESNRKTRKILVATTAVYGFAVLAAQLVNVLFNPSSLAAITNLFG